MKIAMWFRLSMAAATTLMIGGVGATAAELPNYDVVGLPTTPHQFVVLGPANAQQRADCWASDDKATALSGDLDRVLTEMSQGSISFRHVLCPRCEVLDFKG
jgi:hypothetical protein